MVGHAPAIVTAYAAYRRDLNGLVARGVWRMFSIAERHYRDTLDAGQQSVSPVLSNFKSKFAVDWAPFLGSKWTDAADTNVPLAELQRLSERITSIPEGFALHPTVARVYQARINELSQTLDALAKRGPF